MSQLMQQTSGFRRRITGPEVSMFCTEDMSDCCEIARTIGGTTELEADF